VLLPWIHNVNDQIHNGNPHKRKFSQYKQQPTNPSQL